MYASAKMYTLHNSIYFTVQFEDARHSILWKSLVTHTHHTPNKRLSPQNNSDTMEEQNNETLQETKGLEFLCACVHVIWPKFNTVTLPCAYNILFIYNCSYGGILYKKYHYLLVSLRGWCDERGVPGIIYKPLSWYLGVLVDF